MDRSRSVSVPVPDDALRAHGVRRATLVAIATNTVLALGQLVVGLLANAFSLVADAAHTLSDLVTDTLVLLAGRSGAAPADRDHPYGHGRIETATTLLLGTVLCGVGAGFLWASGTRLQDMASAPPLHSAALYMAIATLVAKEALFRFTLAAGRKLRAPMLEANAWHARSDAASSLVVAVGIGGSLAGYPFLEPLAAALVGFLILSMGLRLGWRALRELIDTGLSEAELARLRTTIRTTPGVIDLHDLRTRRMAGRILCDTHVRVDPRITVSEGHRISDLVYFRIRNDHPEVRDVLVHIDAEDDGALQTTPPGEPPLRHDVEVEVARLIGNPALRPDRLQIHYLGQRVEVEAVFAPTDWEQIDHDALKRRMDTLLSAQPVYRSVRFLTWRAPD